MRPFSLFTSGLPLRTSISPPSCRPSPVKPFGLSSKGEVPVPMMAEHSAWTFARSGLLGDVAVRVLGIRAAGIRPSQRHRRAALAEEQLVDVGRAIGELVAAAEAQPLDR